MTRFVLSLLVLAVGAVPVLAQSDSRPNILLILTDDHAYQALSAYGGRLAPIAPTPNIDRIARGGIRFDRSYVTNSICAPSRAVILTGKHSHLNGVRDNRDTFDGSQPTFPKLLQNAGYETALIGKWHLKTEPTGFDYSDRLPGQGFYYNPNFVKNGDTTRVEGYVTDIITDKALEWLDGRNGEGPFLLMLQHKAPHREWSPPLEYLNLFDGVHIPEPKNLFDDYANRGTAARTQDMSLEHSLFMDFDLKVPSPDWETQYYARFRERLTSEQAAVWDSAYGPKNEAFLQDRPSGRDLIRWKYQRYLKDYLRCVRSVDDNIGRVLDFLDDSGLADNTLVIYTSDQGFYLGEHGWFDKRFMYEESFRTPLLMRWPEVIEMGRSTDALVQNLDLAPTILDAAGVPIPADIQGLSLYPLLHGGMPLGWRDALYYHYYEFPHGWHDVNRHEGVFDGRYKLIHFYQLGEWEFYDLRTDPLEMMNRYGDPDYEDETDRLHRELSRLRAYYRVPPLSD